MNNITLTGRLAKDPEMRTTQSGVAVTNFTLAVDRPGTSKENKITDFFDCVAWGGKDGPGRAGVISQYFHKGDGMVISRANLQQKKWTDKDGNQRTGYDVNVLEFEFPMGRRTDGNAPAQQAPVNETPETKTFTPVADDGLPF